MSQKGADGKEHVIPYGSMTLEKAERNSSAVRREMLVMVSFTKAFAMYLRGKRFQATGH